MNLKKILDIHHQFRIIGSMRKTIVQEGVHTVSVYFPPEVVAETLNRPVKEGLTVVFQPPLLIHETTFMKEGEFSDREHQLLMVKARDTIITFYTGDDYEEKDDFENW